MNKRLRSRVLAASMVSSSVLGFGGLVSTQVAMAQDRPSAKEMLDRGARLYEQKQYGEAKKILVDIDPAQLPEDLRAKCAELIKNTDLELAKASGPNGALDAAQANMDGDKLAAAASGFQAIIDDPKAPADVKEKAKIQLTLTREKQAAKAPQMKELLRQAEALYKDGKLEEAQNALTTIQATGSDLGWQDNAKPAKLQAQIDAARTAMARGAGNPATVAANSVVAPPEGGVATAAPVGAAAGPAAVANAPAAQTYPEGPMGTQMRIEDVERQRAQTQYQRSMELSSQALTQNPPAFDAAVEQAKVALGVVDDSRQYFSESEANLMRDRAKAQLQIATDRKAAYDALQTQKAGEITRKAEEERAKRLANQRHQRIHELMQAAMTFDQHQQYREAADQLRQVLVIDPTNDMAKMTLQLITDKINNREWQHVVTQRSRETTRQSIDNAEEMIPYTDLLVYPEYWVELTRNRIGDQSNAETPANRAVRERLDGNLKEIVAEQQGLEKVIGFLRDNTNTNIFVNWTALQAAGIDKNTPVSVNLKEVPFRKALTTILSDVGGGAANLGYTIDEGVITISTRDDLNSAKYQVVRVFDIRDMLVQPDANVTPPTFNLSDITKGGTTSGGGGSSGQQGSLFTDTQGQNQQQNTQTSAQIVQSIVDTIKQTVAPESWRSSGGTIGSVRELNGQLIVNQTVDNQTAVYNLLQQLRETRALQIAIEARLLLVSNNFFDSLGFSWDLAIPAGALGNNISAVGVTNSTASLALPPATGVPGSLGATLGSGNSAMAITGSIIDNWTLNLLIQATQADQRSITVTAPRVTLFNGQRGYIAVTQQQNFVSNFNTTVGTAGGVNGGVIVTGTNLTVSTLTTGVVLYVEATVSADRRYVVMKIRPTLSTLDGLDTFNATGLIPTSQNAGGVAAGFVQLPKISLTTVDTMVSVPDGGTLLIGGQKLVGEAEIEVGVPVLSKIPGLNRLFTNRSMVKDERTLLVLVRPRIIIQREIENDLFGVGYDRPTGLPSPSGGVSRGNGVAPGFSVGGASQ